MWQFMSYLYINPIVLIHFSWWRHQMEIFSALLAICAGNSPVSGEFPAQRPVTRSFDFFFDLRLNKPLSKQWWGWWFETLLCPLWRHCNVACMSACVCGCLLSVHDDVMTWNRIHRLPVNPPADSPCNADHNFLLYCIPKWIMKHAYTQKCGDLRHLTITLMWHHCNGRPGLYH